MSAHPPFLRPSASLLSGAGLVALLLAACASTSPRPPGQYAPAPLMNGCAVAMPGYPPCEPPPDMSTVPYYPTYVGPYYPGTGVVVIPEPYPVPVPAPAPAPKPPPHRPPPKPVQRVPEPPPCHPTPRHPCP